jgi:hypothetical protein
MRGAPTAPGPRGRTLARNLSDRRRREVVEPRREDQLGGRVPRTPLLFGATVIGSGWIPNRIAWSGHSGSPVVQLVVLVPASSNRAIVPSVRRTSRPPSGSLSSRCLYRRPLRDGAGSGSGLAGSSLAAGSGPAVGASLAAASGAAAAGAGAAARLVAI